MLSGISDIFVVVVVVCLKEGSGYVFLGRTLPISVEHRIHLVHYKKFYTTYNAGKLKPKDMLQRDTVIAYNKRGYTQLLVNAEGGDTTDTRITQRNRTGFRISQ